MGKSWTVGAALGALFGRRTTGSKTAEPPSALRFSIGTNEDSSGMPRIHRWSTNALEMPNRVDYRWRIGVTWVFPNALENGMPSSPDRESMAAIDEAIGDVFERDREQQSVYWLTGGGMREVMLYAKSEVTAWKRVVALFAMFPDSFPGGPRAHAYVEEDADWDAYRALIETVQQPS